MPTVHLSILDSVGVASPCTQSWESMTGDERTRHCAACRLNVHNLSGMTRRDAEAFLQTVIEHKAADPAARVCVRFFRRHDGTILTQDCPVGLAAIRRRARIALARTAACIGAAVATAWSVAGLNRDFTRSPRLRELEPFNALSQWLAPGSTPPPPVMGRMVMGDFVMPVNTPPPINPPTNPSTNP